MLLGNDFESRVFQLKPVFFDYPDDDVTMLRYEPA
jgi:hypothetical protein